ncbi:MAG: hypothetical protein FJZ00_10670, partial [Candidatus Sericytochromatia bacterium]|nr:hypothetical protein [Candidatus Tanganyikabacteria bacterium]
MGPIRSAERPAGATPRTTHGTTHTTAPRKPDLAGATRAGKDVARSTFGPDSLVLSRAARDGAPDGAVPGLTIVADTDRDGRVTEADLAARADWRWNGTGAFVIANLDDDDADGVADGADAKVNGAADEADLATVKIRLDAGTLERAKHVRVTPVENGSGGHIRLFHKTSQGWKPVQGALSEIGPEITLGAEATTFASKTWDGHAELKVEARDEAGALIASDQARVRVAPFILLPNSARTTEVYVSAGHPNYENAAFREGLGAAAKAAGARPITHRTSSWKEMWMQDTMEVGYTQLPGRAPQHVVLGGLRGADSFGPRLLGKDTGYIQVGKNRGIANGVDDWADWMGNLEVSPPVPGYPLGRVFYGRNTDTGVTLHPEVVAFLEAQQVQKPFWIDTGFLTIKHVDEIA